MITDLTVVEQRHKAVLEVLEQGAKKDDVAPRGLQPRNALVRAFLDPCG